MSVPTSSETEAVETIKDLLENIDSSDWSVEPDRFAFMWEFDYNSRTQYSGTAVYLWSPLESDISKFSADGDNFRQDDTVECVVMALNRTDTATIAAEIAENISEYYADNEVNTNFTEIRPINISDNRHESQPERSDHFIATVQIELIGLNSAGI